MPSAKVNKITGDIWQMWFKGKLVHYDTVCKKPEGIVVISEGTKVYQCIVRRRSKSALNLEPEDMPPELKAALLLEGYSW